MDILCVHMCVCSIKKNYYLLSSFWHWWRTRTTEEVALENWMELPLPENSRAAVANGEPGSILLHALCNLISRISRICRIKKWTFDVTHEMYRDSVDKTWTCDDRKTAYACYECTSTAHTNKIISIVCEWFVIKRARGIAYRSESEIRGMSASAQQLSVALEFDMARPIACVGHCASLMELMICTNSVTDDRICWHIAEQMAWQTGKRRKFFWLGPSAFFLVVYIVYYIYTGRFSAAWQNANVSCIYLEYYYI